jgi:hypothetical protein
MFSPNRVTRRLLWCLLCLAAVAVALLGGAAAAAVAPDSRAVVAGQINELLRTGRRQEALPLCRGYVAAWPGDGIMAYNLACLENTDGDPDQALTAFATALAAGFSECDRAAADPDLQGPNQTRIAELCAAETARRETLARAQGLVLERDHWSPVRELVVEPGPGGGPTSRPRLRLQWQEAGLEIELATDADWDAVPTKNATAPWNGGPGLLVSLGAAQDGSVLASDNHFLFAFGREGKSGVGGLYVTTQRRWQRVVELDPVLAATPNGGQRLTANIPWSAISPYDPVVDTPLGLNATLMALDGAERHHASLVPTTDTMDAAAGRRHFAPLSFRTESITSDTFVGRLGASLGGSTPLAMDLVAVSTIPGEATLSLNFMDQAGRSVLPEGPLQGTLPLKKGTNLISRQADFSALKNGGYLVEAELGFPSGAKRTWRAPVLQLAAGWEDQYRARLSYVALSEQATVGYLLEAIVSAVARLEPRRNPGAIVTSLIDLESMLTQAEESGSILPEKGSFVFVYPGPDGHNRLCHMYLPAGRGIADGVNPVVVLSRGGALEGRLAARIGQNYEQGRQLPTLKAGQDDRFPVYLVPEFGSDTQDLMAEADACRRWAMVCFRAPAISVVGVDALGWTGLQLASRVPTTLRGVLVFAGRDLDPWPRAQPEFIRSQVGPAPGDLPITWIDFAQETRAAGQGPQILLAIKAAGYRIADEQIVRGSLNLTQIADRIVLWAEGLR